MLKELWELGYLQYYLPGVVVVLLAVLSGLAMVQTLKTNSYAPNLSPATTKLYKTIQIHIAKPPQKQVFFFFLNILVQNVKNY